MKVTIEPFLETHKPYYFKWAEKPHVKSTWFRPGYEGVEEHINNALAQECEHPFIILVDNSPVGYFAVCDLELYGKPCMVEDPQGTFCFDIFIGEENFMGRGIGSSAITTLCTHLFENYSIRRIVIDPAKSNKKAIACYERLGFQFLKEYEDGVDTCFVLEKKRPEVKIYTVKPKNFQPKVVVVACYIQCKGRFLFLHRSKHTTMSGTWGVPAGKLESGETPEEGMARELFEETGIVVKELIPFPPRYVQADTIDYTFFRFRAQFDDYPEVSLSHEHTDFRWVTHKEAEKLPLIRGARDLLDEVYHHFTPVTASQLHVLRILERWNLIDALEATLVGLIPLDLNTDSSPIVLLCKNLDHEVIPGTIEGRNGCCMAYLEGYSIEMIPYKGQLFDHPLYKLQVEAEHYLHDTGVEGKIRAQNAIYAGKTLKEAISQK